MDERRQEQASAFALGVLPEEERFEFERTLAQDPELKKMVGEFTDALGETARSLPRVAPSVGLKAKILGEIADNSRADESEAEPEKDVVRTFSVWIPWAAAAGFAVAATLLFLERNTLRSDRETLIAEVEQARSATTALDRERSELATTLEEMNSEISRLREREATLVAESGRWEADVEALQQERTALERMTGSLHGELA